MSIHHATHPNPPPLLMQSIPKKKVYAWCSYRTCYIDTEKPTVSSRHAANNRKPLKCEESTKRHESKIKRTSHHLNGYIISYSSIMDPCQHNTGSAPVAVLDLRHKLPGYPILSRSLVELSGWRNFSLGSYISPLVQSSLVFLFHFFRWELLAQPGSMA